MCFTKNRNSCNLASKIAATNLSPSVHEAPNTQCRCLVHSCCSSDPLHSLRPTSDGDRVRNQTGDEDSPRVDDRRRLIVNLLFVNVGGRWCMPLILPALFEFRMP